MSSYTTPNIDHNLYRTIVPADYTQQMIQAVQYKQNLYDTGLANVKNKIASMNQLESQVTSEPIRKMIRDYNKEVQGKMSSLSQADFSISSNVDSMTSMYDNLLNDQSFISDYAATKHIKNEYQRAIAMRDSEKKDVYSQFSTTNLQRVMMDLDDLKSANSIDDIKRASSKAMGATYTPYTDVRGNAEKKLKEQGLVVEYDEIRGDYIVTHKNGKMAYSSFASYLNATLNPNEKKQLQIEAEVDFYGVYGNNPEGIDTAYEALLTSTQENINKTQKALSEHSKELTDLLAKPEKVRTSKEETRINELQSIQESASFQIQNAQDQLEALQKINSTDPNAARKKYNILSNLNTGVYSEQVLNNIAVSYAEATKDLDINENTALFKRLNYNLDVQEHNLEKKKYNLEVDKFNQSSRNDVIKEQQWLYEQGFSSVYDKKEDDTGLPSVLDQEFTKLKPDFLDEITGNDLQKINKAFEMGYNETTAYPSIAKLITSKFKNKSPKDLEDVITALKTNNLENIKNQALRSYISSEIKTLKLNSLQELRQKVIGNNLDFYKDSDLVTQEAINVFTQEMDISQSESTRRKQALVDKANAEVLAYVKEKHADHPEWIAALEQKGFYSYDEKSREIGKSYQKEMFTVELGPQVYLDDVDHANNFPKIYDMAKDSPELILPINSSRVMDRTEFGRKYSEKKPAYAAWYKKTSEFRTGQTDGYLNESGNIIGANSGGFVLGGYDDTDAAAKVGQVLAEAMSSDPTMYKDAKGKIIGNFGIAYENPQEIGFTISDVDKAKQVFTQKMGVEDFSEVDEELRDAFVKHFSSKDSFFAVKKGDQDKQKSYTSEDYFIAEMKGQGYNLKGSQYLSGSTDPSVKKDIYNVKEQEGTGKPIITIPSYNNPQLVTPYVFEKIYKVGLVNGKIVVTNTDSQAVSEGKLPVIVGYDYPNLLTVPLNTERLVDGLTSKAAAEKLTTKYPDYSKRLFSGLELQSLL